MTKEEFKLYNRFGEPVCVGDRYVVEYWKDWCTKAETVATVVRLTRNFAVFANGQRVKANKLYSKLI